MSLNSAQLEQFRLQLEEQRTKLLSVVDDIEKTDPANDVDRIDDNADVAGDAKDDEELLRHESLRNEAGIMLNRVNQALERIANGTFGKTLEGEEIPVERLQIDPTATTLVR
jgi:RNA polymerase-binding transcription factor DksA